MVLGQTPEKEVSATTSAPKSVPVSAKRRFKASYNVSKLEIRLSTKKLASILSYASGIAAIAVGFP